MNYPQELKLDAVPDLLHNLTLKIDMLTKIINQSKNEN